ncbi:hypothetical protein K7432_004476 [Basidiobolus ranarum]|uniref:Uncharacterized protein n=1 Tax=Basidiobolus ranarum TaxID=34480 RepID=A0ABR2W4S9_9FUNG
MTNRQIELSISHHVQHQNIRHFYGQHNTKHRSNAKEQNHSSLLPGRRSRLAAPSKLSYTLRGRRLSNEEALYHRSLAMKAKYVVMKLTGDE